MSRIVLTLDQIRSLYSFAEGEGQRRDGVGQDRVRTELLGDRRRVDGDQVGGGDAG